MPLMDEASLKEKYGEEFRDLIWDKHIVPQWEKIFEEALRSLGEDEEDEMSYGGGLEI